VPIVLENDIIGFLNLDSGTPHTFTQQHSEWLRVFAQQAGTAIRNARMVEEISEYATTLELHVLERTLELENEQAQLDAILNAMRDGVIYQVGGLANTPRYVNRALTQITGFSQDEWLDGTAQRHINTRIGADMSEIQRRVDKMFAYQHYWEDELELPRKDGTTFDTRLTRTEVLNNDGERLGIVTVLRDISQAKALEEQKARFIASASHELRTPIANMKTRLFLMKRRPERFPEHIEVAESVVNLMQQLVEDMFDLARFERGVISLEREDVVLQEIIRQVVSYLEPEAERQQIELRIDTPPHPLHVQADPYRLLQVVINLMKNALNYTPVEGVVNIQLTIEGDEALITVMDNGPGIDEKMLSHLFEPFFRLSEDNKGAGLGLSIAQEIVKSHGGSISVESTVGVGSRFTVHLPLHQSQAAVKAEM
jgi:PAS domain S-box-containing protein